LHLTIDQQITISGVEARRQLFTGAPGLSLYRGPTDPRSLFISARVYLQTERPGIRCNCYSPALTRVSITQPDPISRCAGRGERPYLQFTFGVPLRTHPGIVFKLTAIPTDTRAPTQFDEASKSEACTLVTCLRLQGLSRCSGISPSHNSIRCRSVSKGPCISLPMAIFQED